MLKHISIKGYKSIKELDLDLSPINVLIGANGSGKSNFISFFKLLRWMIQPSGQLQFFIGQSGGANSFLFDGAAVTPQIEAELNFEISDGKNKNDYSFRLFHAASDTFIFAEEKYRFSQQTSKFRGLADWRSLDAGHKESKLIDVAVSGDQTARTISRLIQVCVYHQFHDTSQTARIKQRWNVDDNQYLKEDAANLAPFILRIRENEPRYYQRIVETLSQIAPFFVDFVLVSMGNTVLLQWKEIGTDLIFSPHQASDGTLRAMALVALLLQPIDNLPDVLILDEPELGLHPYAINIIGGLINSISNHCQVILATQSTLLIDCFEPENIIVVERDKRQSIFTRLDPSELEDWLEEYSLSELWNKNVIGGRPS
jgi:predicted ATPase